MLFDRNTVFCANAGDSRAVLYSYAKNISEKENGLVEKDEQLMITPMSVDHKPSLQMEHKRIDKMGGRVDPIRGP